jgi:primase-polymerase (primpol)-like protein
MNTGKNVPDPLEGTIAAVDDGRKSTAMTETEAMAELKRLDGEVAQMSEDGIEMYGSRRYFTITGDHLDQTPNTIEDRQTEILDLFFALGQQSNQRTGFSRPAVAVTETDEELIRRAQGAKNGAKFRKLWAGDTSDYGGDHSRADAALCSLLAYYTNGNQARIDRLFRLSGLYRQKWDRPTAGSTYGSITIQAVVRSAT